jgi:HSP20 family protein
MAPASHHHSACIICEGRFDTMSVRWDPFQHVVTLSEAVNRLMQDAVMRPGYALAPSGEAPMNIVERQDTYFIQVALPGVRAEGVELTTQQNTITIKAHRDNPLPEMAGTEHLGYLLAEFGAGDLVRTVTLPKEFLADKIEASLEWGILTVKVPIADRAQPKRISVSEGSPAAKEITAASATTTR